MDIWAGLAKSLTFFKKQEWVFAGMALLGALFICHSFESERIKAVVLIFLLVFVFVVILARDWRTLQTEKLRHSARERERKVTLISSFNDNSKVRRRG